MLTVKPRNLPDILATICIESGLKVEVPDVVISDNKPMTKPTNKSKYDPLPKSTVNVTLRNIIKMTRGKFHKTKSKGKMKLKLVEERNPLKTDSWTNSDADADYIDQIQVSGVPAGVFF